MSLERIVCQSREEWLSKRQEVGIGASEAAAVCGLSPWTTPVKLWRLKTGLDEPADLSDNPAVSQGVRMEPAIRTFFQAQHPEMTVAYHQFDILRQKERPWLFATLDGELTQGGQHGILEIKTATPSGRAGWDKWRDGNIPQNYYIQCMHQLLATGFDFAILFAALYARNGDITLREYEITRRDAEEDMAFVLEKEVEFWKCVMERRIPPTPVAM